jgi:hypothetical protein
MTALSSPRVVPLLVVLFLGWAILQRPPVPDQAQAQEAAAASAADAAEPAPPADQEYIGSKKCSACHFDQFVKWKKTGHSKSFDLLPAKYQADEKCLKCHTTGYGEPTGYKTAADVDLKGTGCEDCHGPGSKHAEISKPFASQKPTAEQAQLCRDSIWKMLPQNVCVTCHMVQGHHDSMTPKELQKP